MRVIAGVRKGLKLKSPDGINTRPTTDRVKESIFNIIQTYLPSNRVLDLFAGSGAMGIEALSRRCEHCTFVEYDKKAFSVVKNNINLAGFEGSSELVFSDSLHFLNSVLKPFDIIFLDPPYNKGFLSPVLSLIIENNLLTDDGIVIVETEKDGEEADHNDYTVIRRATYGKTVVTVLKRGDVQ